MEIFLLLFNNTSLFNEDPLLHLLFEQLHDFFSVLLILLLHSLFHLLICNYLLLLNLNHFLKSLLQQFHHLLNLLVLLLILLL